MKRQLPYICILVLFFAAKVFAQVKPVWIESFENNLHQKEKIWKIDNKIETFGDNRFDYNITLKSNGDLVSIQIARMNDLPNAAETFAGQVIAFGNTMGKKAVKITLKNFGDEAVLWKNNGSVMLDFRKRDIFVHIFTSSEITAKRFAQHVLRQIPND